MNEYLNFLKGPQNETFEHALNRFAAFCRSLHSFEYEGEVYEALFDAFYESGEIFERQSVAEEHISKIEDQYEVQLPLRLRSVIAKPFQIYSVRNIDGRWGDRTILDINKRSEHFPWILALHPFSSAISWNFGDDFLKAEISDEQSKKLDRQYFGFGRWSDDDHVSTYLMFDRNGKFGRFKFDSEDSIATMQALTPFLNGEGLTEDLDELMVWAIDKAMMALLDVNEIPSVNTA